MKPFKKNNHYDNILLLCPDENPLSTISKRKLKFYQDNNLVEEVENLNGYEGSYKLKFAPNLNRIIEQKDYKPIKNVCVVTGNTENLSLHHVVPYCIRKHFPTRYKSKSKEWCVLLTPKMHELADKITFGLYQKDRNDYFKEHKHKLKPMIRKITIYKLIEDNQWDLLPEERRKQLLKEAGIRKLSNLNEADKRKVQDKCKKETNKIYKKWTQKFIKENGGIENVHKIFGELFINTLNPKYLPDGYLELTKKNI